MKTRKIVLPAKIAAIMLYLGLMFMFASPAWAETFSFRHNVGDKFKILSNVEEEIYQNRQLVYRSEFVNKISTQVTEIIDGVAFHSLIYQTAEKATELDGSQRFEWSEEIRSVFGRDARGFISMADKYYLPSVRNVPLFPERDMSPGGTWRAMGEEVHNLNQTLGIAYSEPFHLPFVANYTYLGERQWQGKTYKAFDIKYTIQTRPQAQRGVDMPSRVTGDSRQTIYWDSELGQALGAQENFRLTFEWADGRSIEFRAQGEAITEYSQVMDKGRAALDIEQRIKDLGIKGSSVEITDDGVKLILDNILFEGDSAALRPSEQLKLDSILTLIEPYASRDLLVEGHTAQAGTKEWRDKLSLDRARSVANYFVKKGARTADHVVTKGHGAERPVASNSTEAGLRKNRRVEITILEN
jgi:outer membrane protein OmpA-like peptidoglycan-associated protein